MVFKLHKTSGSWGLTPPKECILYVFLSVLDLVLFVPSVFLLPSVLAGKSKTRSRPEQTSSSLFETHPDDLLLLDRLHQKALEYF